MRTLDKILEELKKQGKTQKDITDYLGISKNVFTDWKSGKNTSYKKHIGKIAEFLNTSTDYLLGTEKQQDPDELVRFALFGGDSKYISAEAYEDVKRFAQIVAEKEKQKKGFDGK